MLGAEQGATPTLAGGTLPPRPPGLRAGAQAVKGPGVGGQLLGCTKDQREQALPPPAAPPTQEDALFFLREQVSGLRLPGY